MSEMADDLGAADAEAGAAATDIAVVGMAGRFPGARNTDEFWRNLRDGVEAVTRFSDDELKAAGVDRATLRDPSYIKSGAVLPEMEMFDAGFFGFNPRDAAIMDPQHRHFLECAWEALESAGHVPEAFPGSIGVFAGSGMHAYLMYNLLTNPELIKQVGMFLIRHTGNDKDFLTTRVSYLLNLQGPSVNIQTACSTSLVAIHTACQSLLNGECDMALAGGVTIEVPHRRGYHYQEGEILSPDGHCRAFDARSQGTIFGSGVGVVVLRRLADALEDGDYIHAVVKGSAVNNDGSLKVGYLAPSVDGQAKAVAEALAIAGVEAESISYIEAHGTGTPVGDPIEVAALTQAFRGQTDKTGFCGLGSVKTGIGHLDTAAGVASFIKVALAMRHGQLPASLHFEAPNPSIDFASSPFYVNNALAAWQPDGVPRRAGVNSLGVGGTNAFVILEEAPAVEVGPSDERPAQLLTLSARSEAALDAATANLARHLREHPELDLADVAHTLQVGRKEFPHRRAVAARDLDDATAALEQRDPKRVVSGARGQADPSVVFMFPGGGAQYPNMGRELYEREPVYREVVDRCLELVRPHVARDLAALMFPAEGDVEAAAGELEKPWAALPALFITEYALAKLWMSRGVQPAAMTGHSMGEYTAACLAGVMSLEEALSLVALRGKLFETLAEGAMLSVRCSEEELQPLLPEALSLAAINAPGLCLASGPVGAIAELEAALDEREVEHSRLKISVASHSAMVEPILEEFGRRVASFRLRPPTMPYISNLTGTWARAEDATDAQYWVRHLRQAVRFSDGIQTLLEQPGRVFLEVGPGQGLSSLAKLHLDKAGQQMVVSSTRHPKEAVSDVEFFLTALGRLWTVGVTPDWSALHDGPRRRVPLPTYPFERQRYWIEPGKGAVAEAAPEDPLAKMESLDDWFYRPVWRRAEPVDAPAGGPALRWLVFKDDRGLGDAVVRRLAAAGHEAIAVVPGAGFTRLDDATYAIDPATRGDYDALVADLVAREAAPQRIVHLWSTTAGDAAGGLGAFDAGQARGFYSLLYLAQAFGNEDLAEPLHVGVVSDRLQPVDGETPICPERATLLGPVRVIPREFPGITCQSIDLAPAGDGELSADRTVEQLLAELATPSADALVALRGDGRWVESFECARVAAPEDGRGRLREGGVYLITGGMGGIGMTQAEHLARTARAKLVLVGRGGLPAREDWVEWLRTHDGREATSRRIRKVQALEELGAEVMVAAADVAELEQMRSVVEAARERFGVIHGVIHAAGVLDDGLIQLKTRESAESVLAPKVRGVLVLDALLGVAGLDFFVLFSSTSAILGPVGQVDYVGANAFLNSFAQSKRAEGGTYTVAVDWGVWREVGMAARAAGGERAELPVGTPAGHPLLGSCIVDTPERIVYEAEYSTSDQWILDQHRIKGGAAVIPGTGYLEIARAALNRGTGDRAVELTDVYFMTPLEVADGERKRVRITLEREGTGYAFSIESATSGDAEPEWDEHARGTASFVEATGEERSVEAIKGRCTARATTYGPGEQRTKQEEYVEFGPRWKVLRRIDFGADEALGLLELPEGFSADLREYRAHPPLLDLATGFALPLIEGYAHGDDFYVPFSYKRVRVEGALPALIYSHARYKAEHARQGLAVFDLTIMDARGRVLIVVEDFTMKRVDSRALAAGQASGRARRAGEDAGGQRPRSGAPDLLQLGLTEGISPSEGAEALGRILAGATEPQLVASSIDLHALIEQLKAAERPGAAGAAGGEQARPETAGSYVAPRNDVEQRLAGFWQELMGVERVGVHDDFFELGGYSLIAVRLFAKIKKAFGVDLGLDVLFQAPTIATCAEVLAEELGIELTTVAAEAAPEEAPVTTNGLATNGVAVNGTAGSGHADAAAAANGAAPAAANGTGAGEVAATKRTSRWSPLVPIQARGSKTPFFCVHGAGGNVLNFRELALQLGTDQPFYGLQAQGVDGKLPPLGSVEDMAALYLEAIRKVQPHGPYLFGGYSGGGVVAFEMAQQLLREGEETALVALLDTFCPIMPTLRGVRGNLRKLMRQGPSVVLTFPKKGLDSAIRQMNRARVKLSGVRQDALAHDLRDLQMWDANLRALSAYRPTVYPGAVTLFRAAEMDPIIDGDIPDLGWTQFAGRGLEIQEIPGDHDSLVLEPNVRILGARMREALEAVGTTAGVAS